MARSRTPSRATRSILDVLNDAPAHGYALMRQTGLRSGTLYPILMRLSDAGLVASEWEASSAPGRPARHVYRLTPNGQALRRDLLAEAAPKRAATARLGNA
ncbi:PadR family transcriptional regulator [uncultured Algimonas sp.]|uniref:PadR family transcriptional regulator n=1 Tax=uncultured Algimonas sp. TaxID=1547920 RepID=UPI0026315345|nr:PadR family transcriptional regulator [uncultured Algimonas sp.]